VTYALKEKVYLPDLGLLATRMVCEVHLYELFGGSPKSVEDDEVGKRLGDGLVNDVVQRIN